MGKLKKYRGSFQTRFFKILSDFLNVKEDRKLRIEFYKERKKERKKEIEIDR